MAVNLKNIIANSLLTLCETYSLETITIKQILDDTGISRQTFYNHFVDKNDLIQYIYDTKIVLDFNDSNKDMNFYDSLLLTFQNIQKYHHFMKQACMMEGQNCLKDYIFEHCKKFDLKWHEKLYGEKLPDALKFATIYHATASSSMTLSWILSDMPVSVEEITKMIVEMRSLGMDTLFQEGKNKENPYK